MISESSIKNGVVAWAQRHYPEATKVRLRFRCEYNDNTYDMQGVYAVVYEATGPVALTHEAMADLDERFADVEVEESLDIMEINLSNRCKECKQVLPS